jgi:hypothetical protein
MHMLTDAKIGFKAQTSVRVIGNVKHSLRISVHQRLYQKTKSRT